MSRIFLTALVASLLMMQSGNSIGQSIELSLEETIIRAREQSTSSKVASTRRENRYWQYRTFKSNYNPQLRLTGNLPGYIKDFTQITQQDGSVLYRRVEQINTVVGVGLQQRLPWTGGEVSVNTGLGVVEDYQNSITSWSSTPFNIRYSQPIFSYNELKWDKLIEPLRYEESRREYVEEMEDISVDAVDRFFALAVAQKNLEIASFNLANNDTIYKIEQGRYNIGTTSKDKLLQVELQLLTSRKDVAQARLDQETALLRLRSYIGISGGNERFILSLPEEIPKFSVTVDEALELARANRAAFIAFERRRLQGKSSVAVAKGQRFQTTLNASYGVGNSGESLTGDDLDRVNRQQLNIGLDVPILNWGRNKSRMQTAIANKELNDFIIAQDEVTFEQEIITQVGQFEMLRLQIEITKKSDEVANERYMVAQNRYLIGKIDITNLNIALKEKDDAKRNYLQALRSFWTAYYELRRLTLYDFAENRLLYNPHLE